MKIALAQLNYHIGNFESNISKIKATIAKAKKQNADLIIFAELATSGYPPWDFLEFRDFIEQCSIGIKSIAKECDGIAAIIGSPYVNPKSQGKNLFNSAYFLTDGRIKSVHHKALLPTYDIFAGYRYFEPGNEFKIVEYKGHKIAITICEDLWNVTDEQMYTICPMDKLITQKPDFLVNISASTFTYDKTEIRKNVLIKNVIKYKLPLFYVNHVGAQTELIFDGGSMVVDDKGNIVDQLNYFNEDFRIYDLNEVLKFQITNHKSQIKLKSQIPNHKIQRIHDALILGIKDYFGKLGFKKAILGLSGGLDSAATLVLAARALGKENVRAVLMPSPFSSGHSIKDAQQIIKNLGCNYDIIAIKDIAESFGKTLKPYFIDKPPDITEENIQARTRAVLLMALANKFGYILLNTSNKSEAAVGYGTLYGDLAGGLSVLGDVYKTEVYELANYINKDKEIIPLNTISKPPSAELRPGQKDADDLPEYDMLDKILYQYIELRKGHKEIIAMGFDEPLVRRMLKLVNTNEYKRYQSPPILRVSPKAFGMGRRMPIVGKYLT
ncbi:MAG: NAD+ synthase [Bacteroidota bacterium]